MRRRVKITTPFPSFQETAKRLGVSKRDVRVLSAMAEHSLKTGEFVIPGVGRVGRKARTAAKKVAKPRVSKSAKNATVRPKK